MAHTPGQPIRPRHGRRSCARTTACGWSRTRATRSARPTTASARAASATPRPSASTPRTTSPPARAARCSSIDARPQAGRVVPRLGSGLLLRAGRGQHLRQALRLAARRSARRLRPQVHLQPHRLQPEGHRHAGRPRALAARQARSVRRGAQGQLRLPDPAAARRRRISSFPRRPRSPTRRGSASRSPSIRSTRSTARTLLRFLDERKIGAACCSPATSSSSRRTASSTSVSSGT